MTTQSRDTEKLKTVAEIWEKVGWCDTVLEPEGISCRGCASVDWCGLYIKQYAQEKGVDNCGKCRDYPCEKLERIFAGNKLLAVSCRDFLSEEEYESFHRAFFTKKERLDKVNKEFFS
jgi:hypothetical protein